MPGLQFLDGDSYNTLFSAHGIVMIADKSDYRYAMGVDHFIYGWVFFGIVIFILFAIGNLFAEDEPQQDARPATREGGGAAVQGRSRKPDRNAGAWNGEQDQIAAAFLRRIAAFSL